MKKIFALLLWLVMLTGCTAGIGRDDPPEFGMGIIFILIGALFFAYGTLTKRSIKNKRGDEYVIKRHYAGKTQFSAGMVMLIGFIALIVEIVRLVQ